MKKLLVGFIMDGKSGGIDKYLLNFLTKVSNEEVRIDFLTNEIDVELQTELKKFHSNLYAIANLKHPVSQYRQVCRIMKEGQYDAVYLNISTAIDCIAAIAAKHSGVERRMIHSHSSGNDCESALKRNLFNGIHKFCRLFLYRYGTEFYGCSVKAGEWLFPKKIVNSYIRDEHLKERPNFRYKKVNIIMGANATGKTSFGQMLMSVFNFIHKKETAYLINRICDVKKEANFSIDFVMNRFTLYSMQIIIHPVNDDDYTENNIEVKIDKIKINKNDSYESCKKRMESKNNLSEYTANYVEELDKLSRLSWLFVSPEKEEKFKFPKGDFKKFILQF